METDDPNDRPDLEQESRVAEDRRARDRALITLYDQVLPPGAVLSGLGAWLPDDPDPTAETVLGADAERAVQAAALEETAPGIVFDLERHLNHAQICPTCGGLLQYNNQQATCPIGHEIDRASIATLTRR